MKRIDHVFVAALCIIAVVYSLQKQHEWWAVVVSALAIANLFVAITEEK